MSVTLINTLIYVLARQDSSLTSSTFINGVLYLSDSIICTVCLIVDGHVLSTMNPVAVLGCAFDNSTMSNLVMSVVAKFSTPMFSLPFR